MPAESVAKLLADHWINCAILNACESARADQGLRANLAATFLEKGVGNVLAMFCKFPSSVIEPFFSVFYEALLCEGLPMSTAAAEARKHLREHGLRKSRFGLELQVQDWFIPVSYHLLRHNVLLGTNLQADSLATCRPVERTTPRANPLITGREFDLLRLEEAVTDAQFVLIHGHAGVGKSGFVQYAFDRWRDTQYFDKLSMVDLPKYLRKPEIGGDKIVSRIAKDLELSPAYFRWLTAQAPGPVWPTLFRHGRRRLLCSMVSTGSSTTSSVGNFDQSWKLSRHFCGSSRALSLSGARANGLPLSSPRGWERNGGRRASLSP